MTLRSRLLDFAAGLSEAVDEGAHQTAEQVRETARELVPVDTGALQASIEVTAGESGGYAVTAGQGLDYAAAVEYGTSKAPAQPFLTPAIEQNRDNLSKNIAAQLKALEERCRI